MSLALLHLALICQAAVAAGEDELTNQQLRELVLEQREQLESQQRQIDALNQKFDRLTTGKDIPEAGTETADTAGPMMPESSATDAEEQVVLQRDAIGDLNEEAVRAGDFKGAVKIPGTEDVSLRIGGFVKTAAILDSDAENMGADFTPATLGTRRGDDDGSFSIDSTLTRLLLDARAPTPENGQLRGYVEWDLNDNNDGSLEIKMRHAYGSWKNRYGTLLAGHTWSTMMDLKTIPEGLTEATVSGVIFQRQSMIRWTQPISPDLTIDIAFEDPNSSDIFADASPAELDDTKLPDSILGIELGRAGLGHLRLTSLLRNIKVTVDDAGNKEDKWAKGFALNGHLDLLEKDRLMFTAIYGEGLGRYLLGIIPSSGGAINPDTNDLTLFQSWGAMTAYEHHWNHRFRSTIMAGYAESNGKDWLPDTNFANSTYASANLIWQAMPYLSLGIEYGYGRRENRDDSSLDNNRIAVGFQFY